MKKNPKSLVSFNVRWMLVIYDTLIYAVVVVFALLLYKNHNLDYLQVLWHFLLGCGLCLISRFLWKVYSQIWRYGGVQSYVRLMLADTCAAVIYFVLQRLISVFGNLAFPIVSLIVFTNTLICLAVRMMYRLIYKRLNRKTKFGRFVVKFINFFGQSDWTISDTDPVSKIKIAIVGAGGIGTSLAEELLNTPNATYKPAVFLDNDVEKLGREIYGSKVIFDDEKAPDLLKEYDVQEVVIALPSSVSPEERKVIYDRYKGAGFKIKSYDYPNMQTTQKGKRTLRDFDIDELLFRKEQEVITDVTINCYKDKVVLVTGGGGSIGSEIARQLATMEPKQLILLDIYENGVYDIQQELRIQYGNELDLIVEICSITNKTALEKVFRKYKPNIVIMAAAHKHVPLMEHNVIEAVYNNVFGTLYTVELAEKYNADRVHMVSTDKAVNPTNVMGATKRMCEMICMTHATLNQHTTFSATRFGNVLGSAGSVIPLFKKQIANGGPITLTDKRIIRYFMTIPEASQLVLHSAAIAKNGELMVLDMGQPVKIYELAINMIELAGFQVDKDIEIVETGLRPGEKLYEELLVKDERFTKTDNEKIFIEQDNPVSLEELNRKLTVLYNAMHLDSNTITKAALHEVVPTFVEPKDINEATEDKTQSKRKKR